MLQALIYAIILVQRPIGSTVIPSTSTTLWAPEEDPSLFPPEDGEGEGEIAGRMRQVPLPTLPPSTTPAPLDLTVQACCGLNCLKYGNIQEMVGLQCCGINPVNYFDKICCGGVTSERKVGRRYFDRCCGIHPYSSWDQTCCQGKVFEGISLSCCGPTPYSLYDRSKICCSGVLFDIPSNMTTGACCGAQMYDAWKGKQFCCGAKIYSNTLFDGCCVGYTNAALVEGYNSETQICCDGVFPRKTYDSCCYTDDPLATDQFAPPKPVAYNTTVFCCNYKGVRRKLSTGVCPSLFPIPTTLAPPPVIPLIPPA